MQHTYSNCIVYFDHNVLDSIIKNDPHHVRDMFHDSSVTAVFSDENLKEIIKSKGYEDKFLAVLKELKAKHIKSVLDNKFIPTGQAEIRAIDPGIALASYVETITPYLGTDYNLTGMLQKFYGGLTDMSYAEIFDEGTNSLVKMLNSAKSAEGLDPLLCKQMDLLIGQLPEVFGLLSQQLNDSLGSAGAKSVTCQFEDATGIAPITLNNIKGTNILTQIWDIVKQKVPTAGVDMETFFGLKTTPWLSTPREPTISEKVNSIYHQLNFLGYYRDTNMKMEKRFNASFSDMTHAGMASFCNVFLCLDEGLVRKAAAAYEYLKVGTQINSFK